MVQHTLKAIGWVLSLEAKRLGWAGVAGVALMVFAAVFYFTAVSGVRSDIAARSDEVRQLRERQRATRAQASEVKPALAQQLRTFYEYFPNPASLPQRLGNVYALAAKREVKLERGEYKLIEERGGRLVRYQLTLPVAGTYVQIRGLVGDILTQVPAAVLDEIAFKRETIGATTVEAQIRLTLYMGAHES